MSDLCMYELEDIVWDEFGQSDDHIVPHPGDEHASELSLQHISRKKPRRDVIGVSTNAGDLYAANNVSKGEEQREFPILNNRKNKMLEKDSWFCAPDGAFPASCDGDSIQEVTSLASDNTMLPSHCFKSSNIDPIGSEFCANDPILGDKCGAVDNNSFNYPLGLISQTDNYLSFLDNNREDNESSDIFYYSWADIRNFEDVDRMFRNCDSTFGLGGGGNEDELGWFSSSDAIEGSEDALKADFKFCTESSALENISENHDPSKLNNGSCSINDPSMKTASLNYKVSSDDEPATVGHLSFVNGSDKISEKKDKFMSKAQGVEFNGGVQCKISTINHLKKDNIGMVQNNANLHKKQSKHQKQSEGKRKDRCSENGGSLHYIGNLRNKDMKLPSGNTSCHIFTSVGIRQQKQNLAPDSFAYLQTDIPYMHSEDSHPSDQTTLSPTLSGIRSENNGLTSLSPKESSYASNQVQSMESSHDPLLEVSAFTPEENRDKLHHRPGFQTSFPSNSKHVDMLVQASIGDPVSVGKQVLHSGNEFENNSDVEGVSIGIPGEFDSSNVQESSSMSSGLEEISLEATSFRQLQAVMGQLDLRTKLCIRDSLYRLARSAEQRHNHANLNGGGDDRDTNGALMAEGTNKCAGFMVMETDTNPIDRSIAHLLFHRPSDTSIKPGHETMSLKLHATIHGSITSPPLKAEKPCQEETSNGTAKKVADH